MARTAAEGGRVVLVVATRGERGEPQPGVMAANDMLWEHRIPETFAAAEILGVDRVEFLGYVDSGMMGEPTNDFPYSFWRAELDRAANRLAAILAEEQPDVLTVYDDNGVYGHPDHIQVHRVGVRAAQLAGVDRVLQATMNRTRIQQALEEHAEDIDEARLEGLEVPAPTDDFGKPESEITHGIDVSGYLEAKRAAMAAHASQISGDSWFLSMDDEMFAEAFGTEWFIETGAPRTGAEPLRSSLWQGAPTG